MLSTKHIVLGLLTERRGYGYDLQQRIAQRFGFLGLSETAIYALLDRLERDSFIAEAERSTAGRTRRGVERVTYEATAAGVEEFRRWMRSPCEPAVLREDLHAKLVLCDPDDLGWLIDETEAQERACLAELQKFASTLPHEMSDGELPWPDLALLLVDDARASRLQATIDWLQRVRAVLEKRVVASGSAHRSRVP